VKWKILFLLRCSSLSKQGGGLSLCCCRHRASVLGRLTPREKGPHAQHTRTPLHPAALASVPYGVVLVRVRERKGRIYNHHHPSRRRTVRTRPEEKHEIFTKSNITPATNSLPSGAIVAARRTRCPHKAASQPLSSLRLPSSCSDLLAGTSRCRRTPVNSGPTRGYRPNGVPVRFERQEPRRKPEASART